MARARLVSLVPFLVSTAACLDERALAPANLVPTISGLAATVNPQNALSIVVTFSVANADSARVRYWAPNETPRTTPFSSVRDGAQRIATLGLTPATFYTQTVEAVGKDTAVTSFPVTLQAGDLPISLQSVHLDVAGSPSPGYVLASITRGTEAFAVAFDKWGAVRWYRQFSARPGEMAIEAKQQTNDNFTLFLGISTGWQPAFGRFLEFAPDGNVVRTYSADPPYYTDSHELLLTPSDAGPDAHLFGYDLRLVDLTAMGGSSNVLLAGHTILRQTMSGSVNFLWNAWDHIDLEDWVERPANLAALSNTDFDHPNSLEIDTDGNYIASFRNLSAIMKIDAVTGATIWWLGGRRNEFQILNDPLGGFSAQHTARVLENGELLVYDNGVRHTPSESRAVQYRLDSRAMTATMVWEFRHTPALFTPFAGSAQRYANGNTLIGFSTAAVISEVDGDGGLIWEGRLMVDGQPIPFFYRALMVPSLYQYQRP